MRKFIITSKGEFRYGDVRMHKELLQLFDVCRGGGFYEFDYVSNRLLLSGRSFDFGKPRWDSVGLLRMPRELSGLTILYEGLPLENDIEFV